MREQYLFRTQVRKPGDDNETKVKAAPQDGTNGSTILPFVIRVPFSKCACTINVVGV